MNGKELINTLNEKGAVEDYYKILYSPNVIIDSKWWNTSTLLITINDFVDKFINNLDIENYIYVYDIKPNIDDSLKFIRYFEHNTICEHKIRIKKLIKIKKLTINLK